MQIFQRNILNKYIEGLDNTLIDERYKTFSSFFLDPERQANILNSKEEQFQEGFLRELFVKILGYTLNPDPNFNLTTEKKNETNSKKADGAILVDGKVVGVIELKDHKTPDLSKVEAQAFNYKSQHKEALYVVISNFEKLRFYIDNAVDFEEFDLFHLTRDDFARLWICLAYENIAKNLPKQIKAASLTNEDQITNALYKDYSNFKRDLFEDILQHNPKPDTDALSVIARRNDEAIQIDSNWELLLFKKTQKLLDRLLFIFFAEDRGLLPPNSIMLIINQWEKLKELDEYQPFYDRLKKYFGYMNTGFQGKNYEVFAYNGGLFKPDEILDGLTISDEVLMRYCKKISDYDFQSDVDVNILGHIFENSLTEIEEITTKLQQGEAPTISKRKKDGVFYTPQYITKYIVENTVGKLCREKKAELGIDESEYFTDKKRQVATKKALIEKLEAYREWLLQISICDPACGSGAFLNAALNFLIAEHKLIDEMQAKVEGASLVFPNVENSILENNLYGVDINEESVEIAKLSLWLRTAKPHRKLNSLNDNIKCGNSLIDDPAIAGDKAFNWQTEFPKVFEKGGFDVVIGNPPYGAQLTQIEQDHLENKFKLKCTDTACLFMGLALNIVKDNSPISYIIPKPFLYASNWKTIRSVMLPQITSIVDCSKVWSEVKLEQIIFNEVKGLETQCYDSLKRIDSDFLLVATIDKSLCQKFDFYLNGVSTEEIRIAEKMLSFGTYLNDFVINQRGAMYQKEVVEAQSDYKVFGGKQVGRYYTKGVKGYISNESIKEERGKIKNNSVLAQNIIAFIENPYPHIKIIATIAKDKDDIIILDTINQLSVNEEFDNRYILSIINSNLLSWYVYRFIFGLAIRTMHFDNAITERIPIPAISLENQQPFIAHADQMLSLIEQLQQKRQRFLHRLEESLGVQKITAALERFDEADFAALLAELKKQKISLTLVQKDEWEDYFTQYKAACNALTAQIAATDKEIDQMVYQLYALTEDEIKVVEG